MRSWVSLRSNEADEMSHRAAESIEPPDDEGVAFGEVLEAGVKSWSICSSTRDVVSEDRGTIAASLLKRVELESEVLVFGADSCVAKNPAHSRKHPLRTGC